MSRSARGVENRKIRNEWHLRVRSSPTDSILSMFDRGKSKVNPKFGDQFTAKL
jgi:hypothetical protein